MTTGIDADQVGVGVDADVAVVGAGPTGLALALQAHALGARVRLVEQRAAFARPSKALIVHPRTLEVLRPLGVTDALLARGDAAPVAQLHVGRRVAQVHLDAFHLPDTAFPHLLLIRQTEVEGVLSDALSARGVEVERGREVVGVTSALTGARLTVRRGDRIAPLSCRFAVGCDGHDSIVRAAMGARWRGAAHRQEVILADLELDADLAPGVVHAVPAAGGLVFLFALGERARWRLLATQRAASDGPVPVGRPSPGLAQPELQAVLDGAGLDATITDVAWSAQVALQHRLADRYRRGPLFIAGDAAHAHSPAGGQGMNLGIQDAVNLGWKLAFAVPTGDAVSDADILLASYEAERRPVARRVIAMTRAIFWSEAGTDPFARLLRGAVRGGGGWAVPLALSRRRLTAAGVRMLSQLRVGYADSPISGHGSGSPRSLSPGSRLPDALVMTAAGPVRLHALTAVPGVHVVLDGRARLSAEPLGAHVHVHRCGDGPGDGIVAVRPDGYVGFHGGVDDEAALRRWLRLVHAAGQRGPAGPRDNGARAT